MLLLKSIQGNATIVARTVGTVPLKTQDIRCVLITFSGGRKGVCMYVCMYVLFKLAASYKVSREGVLLK